MLPRACTHILSLIAVVTLWILGTHSEAYSLEDRQITIGTGGATGVYYPVGGAICRLVNERSQEHGIRCTVERTEGSIENINSIRSGKFDLGVVQSDWQYHAFEGSSKFSEQGPFKDLRAVFSLYSEAATVVARRDSGIRRLEDLRGHRVNIGNPGSGTRFTWDILQQELGWAPADLVDASELASDKLGKALCKNKIDAYFWLVGHPSGVAMESFMSCDAVLVEVNGPAVERLLEKQPYYAEAVIPGGTYNGNTNDVATFGVLATVVSSATTPPDIIFEVTRVVFDNLETFKTLHPALSELEKKEMIEDGRSAPLHDGAKRYFEQQHLM
jgi:TRAP transporter TAXI family solute receptor